MRKKPLVHLTRLLRQRQTDAENRLWCYLRNRQLRGIKFRRQHRIGGYIEDFISLERNLILELDGGQHAEPEIQEKDRERTAWLQSEGYKILRFWNNDIFDNLEGVIDSMLNELGGESPSS